MISPGDFQAKVDLQSAYRSVRVSQEERYRLGIPLTFESALWIYFLVDCCLPFGHARSCFVFHELSQLVVKIMNSFGFHELMAYLDDFLVSAHTFQQCKEALESSLDFLLIFILRRLGFAIAYYKVESPVRSLTFLGFLLNTVDMTVAVTKARVSELNELLLTTLIKPN